MEVQLNKVGKRFKYDWIFKNISLELKSPLQYAVQGPNGSGKSTLLKILSGHLTPSKGKINFLLDGKKVDPNLVYKQVAFAGPYIDLIETFTLKEIIEFHQQFKKLLPGFDSTSLIERMSLKKAKDKQLKFYSSGMKQRVKLALAICSQSKMLLLDEPTTNLDTEGIRWYRQLIEDYGKDRLLIVASNAAVDFDFCQEKISILDYK
ncbi:MAG: ABC transporter ATP-binding protein [Bacteroidota bacterium]